MIYLNGKKVVKWLGQEGDLYVVELPGQRTCAVKLGQLAADHGDDEIATAARNALRSQQCHCSSSQQHFCWSESSARGEC